MVQKVRTEDNVALEIEDDVILDVPLLRLLLESSVCSPEAEAEAEVIPVRVSAWAFSMIIDFIKKRIDSEGLMNDIDFTRPGFKEDEIEFLADVFSQRTYTDFVAPDQDVALYVFYDNFDRNGPHKPRQKRFKNRPNEGIFYVKNAKSKPYEVIRPDVIDRKLGILGLETRVNYTRAMRRTIELANAADFYMKHDLMNLLAAFIAFLIHDLSTKQTDALLVDKLSSSVKKLVSSHLERHIKVPYFPDKFYSRKTKLGNVEDFAVCDKLLVHAFTKSKFREKKLLEDAVTHRRLDFLIYAQTKNANFHITLVYIACRVGDPACLKFLFDACRADRFALSCVQAVDGGNLECFKFILEKNYDTCFFDACEICIVRRRLEMLQHAVSVGCRINWSHTSSAVKVNSVECLKYVTSLCRSPSKFSEASLIETAMSYGSLDCVRYMIEQLGYNFNIDPCKRYATFRDRLECLKYLVDNHNAKLDEMLLVVAIVNHSYECMKYIISERFQFGYIEKDSFKIDAINAQNIEFLKCCKFFNESHANAALIGKKLTSLEYLAENQMFPSEHLVWEMFSLFESGAAVKILLKNGYKLSDRILNSIVVNCNTEILKICNEPAKRICTFAAKCGSVKCLKFVKSLGKTGSIDKRQLLERAQDSCKWYIRSQF